MAKKRKAMVYTATKGIGSVTDGKVDDTEESVSPVNTRSTADADSSGVRTTSDISGIEVDSGMDVALGGRSKKGIPKPRRTASMGGVDLKVVRMLLVVCTVYVVLITPTFLLFVFQEVFQELRQPRWVRVNLIISTISFLLMAINSSVNFVIYVCMSQKFRKSFKEISPFRK